MDLICFGCNASVDCACKHEQSMRPKDRSCAGDDYPYSRLVPTNAGLILRHVCSEACAFKLKAHLIQRINNK